MPRWQSRAKRSAAAAPAAKNRRAMQDHQRKDAAERLDHGHRQEPARRGADRPEAFSGGRAAAYGRPEGPGRVPGQDPCARTGCDPPRLCRPLGPALRSLEQAGRGREVEENAGGPVVKGAREVAECGAAIRTGRKSLAANLAAEDHGAASSPDLAAGLMTCLLPRTPADDPRGHRGAYRPPSWA